MCRESLQTRSERLSSVAEVAYRNGAAGCLVDSVLHLYCHLNGF